MARYVFCGRFFRESLSRSRNASKKSRTRNKVLKECCERCALAKDSMCRYGTANVEYLVFNAFGICG